MAISKRRAAQLAGDAANQRAREARIAARLKTAKVSEEIRIENAQKREARKLQLEADRAATRKRVEEEPAARAKLDKAALVAAVDSQAKRDSDAAERRKAMAVKEAAADVRLASERAEKDAARTAEREKRRAEMQDTVGN